MRTPTALGFATLFTVNMKAYIATADSGTAKVKLTRSGGGGIASVMNSVFNNAANVGTALSMKYDTEAPGGGTVITLPTSGPSAIAFSAAGEFELPAQAYVNKRIAATMADTGRVLTKDLLTAEIYTFPNVNTTVFKTTGNVGVSALVAGTDYWAVTSFTGGSDNGRLPPIDANKVESTVGTITGSATGTQVAAGDTTVTVTFKPSTQGTPPECTALKLTLANGASKTYSGSPLWAPTMYTLPNHAATNVNVASITAGTATTVTVEYTNSLGSPVGTGNVFIRIGTGVTAEEFQASNFLTSPTRVSASVSATRTGINLDVAIVVKYHSETGLSTEVPTVGAAVSSSSKITVVDALYLLQASTMDRTSNEWSGNTAGTANWGIAVAASKFKEYKPDVAGEFALVAKASATSSFMFRGLGSAWSSFSTVSKSNIKYLVIVENDAVVSAGTVTSAVKWKATHTGNKTCTVTSSKGSFGGNGTYTTNLSLGNASAGEMFTAVYVNGQPVTVASATSIGPFTEAKGLKAGGYTLPDGVLGGLCYTDYVMHIVFAEPVTLEITGFNVGPASADSGIKARSGTFAYAPRFGMFNAYGSTAYGNANAFVGAFTNTDYTNFGIPQLETAATLGPRLALAYGMRFDADSAIEFARQKGSLTVTDGTTVTLGATLPAAALNARTALDYTSGLTPIATVATPWPWSGYVATDNLSGSQQVPMGYFSDMSASGGGLPIVANNGTSLPAVTIKDSVSGKKYLVVDPTASKTWVLGGIPTGSAGFASGQASFGGTVIAGVGSPATLMGNALSSFRSTMVSWVGCAFHNQTCLQAPNGVSQTFPWVGFYLGSGVAQSSGVMGKDASNFGVGINKVIAWDIGQANGTLTWSSSTGGLVTSSALNGTTAHNVLMWYPLAGTDPADRSTLHVFTLCVDNQASDANLTSSNVGNWVRLYQNGVKLTLASTVSETTINPQGTTGGVKNILFSSGTTAKDTLVGGAPVPNARVSVGSTTRWAFAENDVRAVNSTYNDSECEQVSRDLALKWGIVPRISASSGDIATLDFQGLTWTGSVRVMRIGFFLSAEKANGGLDTDDVAWNSGAVSGKSLLGFKDTADWATDAGAGGDTLLGSTRGMVSQARGTTFGFSRGYSVVSNDIPVGSFVRLNISAAGVTADKENVRFGLTLVHGGTSVFYVLGFSHNGEPKNTAEHAFFDSTGKVLANKGIFRLVRSNGTSVNDHNGQASAKSMWANPYVLAMDSTVAVDVSAVAAMTQSSSALFSIDARNALYASPVDWLRVFGGFYGGPANSGQGVGRSIPPWHQTTSMVTCWEVGKTTGTPGAKSAQPYWFKWGDVAGVTSLSPTEYSSLFRALMKFDEARVVKRLVVYATTPGLHSPWPKFEIVASKNGTHFVRLPTKWRVSNANVTEDTFHLDHRRRRWNDAPFSYAPALGMDTAVVIKDALAFPATNNFVYTGSAIANVLTFLWTIDIDNTDAYTHYGIGNVGTDMFHKTNTGTDDTTRALARHPLGYYSYAAISHNIATQSSAFQAEPWVPTVTTAAAGTKKLNTRNQSGGNVGGEENVRVLLPQVSSDDAVTQTFYRFWRIRATTAFLGACGASSTEYFWKLGLYRDKATADADTNGLSSNNYMQQWANVINNNGSQETAGNAKHNLMFVSTGLWSAAQSAAGDATKVTFTAESTHVTFKLDVAGRIGAIRFPDAMYYDINVRGGTFIVEASEDGSGGWVTMVADCGGKKLGRIGTLDAMPSSASASAGSVTLTNKVFTLTAKSSDATPTAGTLSGAGSLAYGSAASCSIVIVSNDRASYVADDFSVHLCASGGSWSAGTKFNCAVTGYTTADGKLSFTVTPEVFGANCFFHVLVRSAQGTGALITTLSSTPFTVTGPAVQFAFPLPTSSGQNTWGGSAHNGATATYIAPGLMYPTAWYRGTAYWYAGALTKGNTRWVHPRQSKNATLVTGALATKTFTAPISYDGVTHPYSGGTDAISPGGAAIVEKIISAATFELIIYMKSCTLAGGESDAHVCSMCYGNLSTLTNASDASMVKANTAGGGTWEVYGAPHGWNSKPAGTSTYGHYFTMPARSGYIKFKRASNTLTMTWSTTSGGHYSSDAGNGIAAGSVTCANSDSVICLMGQGSGYGEYCEIFSYQES
jgi:hypothetical protein